MREADRNRRLFHRGHWEIIAARFREQLSKYPLSRKTDDAARTALAILAISMAERFEFDNEAFQPETFLTRCSSDPNIYDLAELWTVKNAGRV